MIHSNGSQPQQEMTESELLRIIFNYTGLIAGERKLENVLQLMSEMGRKMTNADRCSIWLVDEKQQELYTLVAHGVEEIRIPAKSGLVGLSIESGRPIIIDDAYADNPYKEILRTGAHVVDKQTGYRTRSIMVIPFKNNDGRVIGAFQAINNMTAKQKFSEQDLLHLTLASSYAGKSLESVLLQKEIEDTQKELLFTMGEIGESRSKETGNHVKRVAEYSYILALGSGMDKEEAELIKMVSPMHDIGKVAIPDTILQKPGKLTEEEFEWMKTHTVIGYKLLNNPRRRLLSAAAVIAHEHHEKWNGGGYPRGLQGEEIHIYGRITAVADVFDALASDRVYKKAWELDRILQLFHEERGEHFDPNLVDVFMEQLPALLQIRDTYVDV